MRADLARRLGEAKERFEAAAEGWGRFVCRNPWKLVFSVLVVTAWLVSWLPELHSDFSSDHFLLPDDPALEVYEDFRDQYGAGDRTLVAIRTPNVFDLAFLEKLRSLHRALESEVPFTEEVSSLVNARWTHGDEDELLVEDFMADWPSDARALAELRRRAFANPLYVDTLFTRDARFAAVAVKMDAGPRFADAADALAGFESPAAGAPDPAHAAAIRDGPARTEQHIAAIARVVERFEGPDFHAYLAGGEVMGQRLQSISLTDTPVFLAVSTLVIVVSLLLLFGRLGGALLPIGVVGTSIVATFGCMAWLEIPFTIPTQMIPSFLLVVGVCDSMHLLTIVYQRRAAGEARDTAVVQAVRHSALGIVMTSATTAGGLASFSLAEISPVAQLGTVAPLGVSLALFYTLTLLPALLVLLPSPAATRLDGRIPGARVPELMAACGDAAMAHPWKVVGSFVLVVCAAGAGVAQLRFAHDPLRWLLDDDPVRRSIEQIDREFGGIVALELVADTGEEFGLYDPEKLERLDRAVLAASEFQQGQVEVGKVTSIVDVVKEINQALNGQQPAFYRVPGDRDLIAQELLLFESSGSDDLEQVSDNVLRTARITLRISWSDGLHYGPFLDALLPRVREILGTDIDLQVTGQTVLESRAFGLVLSSMARSYTAALLVVGVLLVLVAGSWRRGLLSLLPNLVPVYLTLALMGWLGITLNAVTMLVGSIVIGLAVDDTIHVLHGFDRLYRSGRRPEAAVRETLRTTGSALLVTSLVLAAGFFTFLASHMRSLQDVGLLAGFAVLVALAADVFLAPALLVLASRSREHASPALGAAVEEAHPIVNR